MKIGLDLRFLQKGDYYSNFVFKLVQLLINDKKENKYNIYLNMQFLHVDFGEHTNNISIEEAPGSLLEQINFSKVLKADNNELTFFFDYRFPVRFKGKSILFLANLVDFHYPSKENIFKKYLNNLLLNTNSRNALKIICFNELTKNEINDKLNISEEKIKIITPFYNKLENNGIDNVSLDIKAKYNINGDYILYSDGAGSYKNLDRLVKVFSKNSKLNLVFIDDSSIKDLEVRRLIIEKNITNRVYFIGDISKQEEKELHLNSLGIVFPTQYESFPFSMEKALNYKTKILTSNIKNIKDVLGGNVEYFIPSDSFDLSEKLDKLINSKSTPNYSKILEKYSVTNTYKELIKVVSEV